MREGRTSRGLWIRTGGSGKRLLVLLHGLGANSSVWSGLISRADREGNTRWAAPDLRGHGRSPYDGPYGYGMHAADIAALLEDEDPACVTVAGHSLGGVVAALLGGGLFGPPPSRIAALGVKLSWSTDEVDRARQVAGRPSRSFASQAEAIQRYLKVSGLEGLVDPASEEARLGSIGGEGGYGVAMDPRVFSAVGPSIVDIMGAVRVLMRLAAGSADPMVSADEMRRFDPDPMIWPGLGHNAHRQDPETVWRFIDRVSIVARSGPPPLG